MWSWWRRETRHEECVSHYGVRCQKAQNQTPAGTVAGADASAEGVGVEEGAGFGAGSLVEAGLVPASVPGVGAGEGSPGFSALRPRRS